jgi:imidazolonepropionase-like amidohydrolase
VWLDQAQILDVSSGQTLEASVEVSESRVERIVPSELHIAGVDLHGAYLLPGLVDVHFHAFEDPNSSRPLGSLDSGRWDRAVANLRQAAAAGVTAIREVGAPNRENLQLREISRSIGGPDVYSCGNLITAPGGHAAASGREVTANADQLRRAVDEELSAGADFIKLINFPVRFTPTHVATVVEEALAAGRTVAYHAGDKDSAEIGRIGGVRTIEHALPELRETSPLLTPSSAYVPTLACAKLVQGSGGDYLLEGEEEFSVFEAWERFLREREKSLMDPAIEIFIGTDACIQPLSGDAIHHELDALRSAGMPVARLLSSAFSGLATLEPPPSQMITAVVESARPNLIAVDENPLINLATLIRPRMVMIRGNIVNPETR